MPEIDRLLGNMVMTDVEFRSVEGTSQKIYGYSNTFWRQFNKIWVHSLEELKSRRTTWDTITVHYNFGTQLQ